MIIKSRLKVVRPKYLDYIVCWSIGSQDTYNIINISNNKYLIYENKKIEVFELSSLLKLNI